MDVANPSNLARIIKLFEEYPEMLSKSISAYCISDKETLDMTRSVYKNYNYLMDPHGAVAFLSLQHYLQKHPGKKGIFLETAHPVKFPETAEEALGKPLALPSSIVDIMKGIKLTTVIGPDYSALKDFLTSSL
jgi:threonine synthase